MNNGRTHNLLFIKNFINTTKELSNRIQIYFYNRKILNYIEYLCKLKEVIHRKLKRQRLKKTKYS